VLQVELVVMEQQAEQEELVIQAELVV